MIGDNTYAIGLITTTTGHIFVTITTRIRSWRKLVGESGFESQCELVAIAKIFWGIHTVKWTLTADELWVVLSQKSSL